MNHIKLFNALNAGTIPPNNAIAAGIAHTLSNPSKMPGKAYGIPAGVGFCNTGGKLVGISGSVCNECYACRGAYRWNSTHQAQLTRLEATKNPLWPLAMVKLIQKQKYFRWFDSGDLQGLKMLLQIIWIAGKTPETEHWLPTKEIKLIRRLIRDFGAAIIPDNLIIRVSSPMIDQKPLAVPDGINTTTVHNNKPHYGTACRAPFQGNECRNCRACWNKSIKNISYKKH